ncbi:pentapeptide repeat-containing protein [Streptomyces sp. DSM 41527]|uniref:Pentapeptide repeat-containing protein n=1 Tax=Streptomyces mooreae TaxID=3075523 RepID=A0ABU2TAW9_9ACTN|nr:pentapeptide repeat-containing protein [Streptomyces sp. DSM 41527]MDT0458087.1 pentapeptide repeat-containing protein [Streptomyces sp. DSM 41527]
MADFSGASFLGDARFDQVTFGGAARFGRASFAGMAEFGGASFAHTAEFSGVVFCGDARFGAATFSGGAWFGGASFSCDAWFRRVSFSGTSGFGGASFSATAHFDRASFCGDALFDRAAFSRDAEFDGASFRRSARFDRASFRGDARFGAVEFCGDAWFVGVTFSRGVLFRAASFCGNARFGGASVSGAAEFEEVVFWAEAWFVGVTFFAGAQFSKASFSADARFVGVTFCADAQFSKASFSADARFDMASFFGAAEFDGAVFSAGAGFSGARFAVLSLLGPLVCTGEVNLSGAVFEGPVTVEAAAGTVRCVRTRWNSTATLRLRYATVELSDAVLCAPVAVIAHPVPFASGTVDESPMAASTCGLRVASVRGVDAAHLVLTDTDLSSCVFSGAFHLDQLRLEGRITFASPPAGFHRVWPHRWTRRRTLAEEHHWRALTTNSPGPPLGWQPGPHHMDPALSPGPGDLAATYRQVRKAFEDSKNEPGAADFYYGEMEMRRHDRVGTPAGERGLLSAYWLVSGYGLRASRALAWLIAAMTCTVMALVLWGLPFHDPEPHATGTLTSGGRITLTTTTPEPSLTGPWMRRLAIQRAEKATRVVVNSVVFRSSGQNLTTAGTYIEMTSRLLEPALLALAALAVRGRVKR